MKNDRIQGIIFNHKAPVSGLKSQSSANRLSRRAVVFSKKIMEIVPNQLSHLKLHRASRDEDNKKQPIAVQDIDDLLSRLKDL